MCLGIGIIVFLSVCALISYVGISYAGHKHDGGNWGLFQIMGFNYTRCGSNEQQHTDCCQSCSDDGVS